VSPILADAFDVVIGVDAHTDTHSAALLTVLGTVLAELTVPADAQGAAALRTWADARAPKLRRAWVIDGARSHGLGLARHLDTGGETVLEAPRLPGAAKRRGGKSDALDAIEVARAVLARQRLNKPRSDGDREALRLLHVCRRHYSDTRTATVNLFKSLILTAQDELREQLRNLTTGQQVRRAAALTAPAGADLTTQVRHQRLAMLAADIAALDRILADNEKQLRALVKKTCPALLDQPGIGPVTAAIALTAWSHKDRLRNEAAFAALAGVSPIPASSGRIVKHRLNRGGDRTLNAAIHTIATVRRRCHQPTRDYVARRTGQGQTPKEISRCLKRYIARQLFRIMQATA
jgi:transposase